MINYHFHDDLSADATGALGLHCGTLDGRRGRICVTNHAETLDGEGRWIARADEMIRRFERSADAVRAAREHYPRLEIRLGVELEYRPEWVPAYERLLAAVPFDFVLGSVHRVEGLNISGGFEVDAFFLARSEREAYEAYFRDLREMVQWGGFDVVAHFDLIKRYGHRHYGAYRPQRYRSSILPVLGEMARRGIGLEINTSGVSQAPGVPYPEPEILEWAREVGVQHLTIGSDSHAPGQFAQGLAEGVALAAHTGWTDFTLYERRRPVARVAVAA